MGAAIPVGLLLAYNLVSTGQLVHPAYDYLYRLEARGYPSLGYQPDWAIEDSALPAPEPRDHAASRRRTSCPTDAARRARASTTTRSARSRGATRGLFDVGCPLAVPSDVGMSVLLTSPAFLLALAVARGGYGRSRLVTGAILAIVLVASST